MVDQQGVPLSVALSAANVHDLRLLEPLVDAVPPVWRPVGESGRPRRSRRSSTPTSGYDYPVLRRALRCRGITPLIARCWVERSNASVGTAGRLSARLAWLLAFRRLTVRYYRHAAPSVLAFLHLACALICLRFLRRKEAV